MNGRFNSDVRAERTSNVLYTSIVYNRFGRYDLQRHLRGADVRSEMFHVSGVGTLQACMRRQVNGQSVRHITCSKQQMKQKFISSYYNLYTQFIYS